MIISLCNDPRISRTDLRFLCLLNKTTQTVLTHTYDIMDWSVFSSLLHTNTHTHKIPNVHYCPRLLPSKCVTITKSSWATLSWGSRKQSFLLQQSDLAAELSITQAFKHSGNASPDTVDLSLSLFWAWKCKNCLFPCHILNLFVLPTHLIG